MRAESQDGELKLALLPDSLPIWVKAGRGKEKREREESNELVLRSMK